MKYLIIDDGLTELIHTLNENKKITVRSSNDDNLELADCITLTPDEITDIVNKFSDEYCHLIFTETDNENYAEFRRCIQELRNSKKHNWPKNLTIVQEIEDGYDAAKIAEEMINTKILHGQLVQIVKRLKNTSVLNTEDNKVVTYYYNPETSEEEKHLESDDIFAESLLYSEEGFTRIVSQWLCIEQILLPF